MVAIKYCVLLCFYFTYKSFIACVNINLSVVTTSKNILFEICAVFGYQVKRIDGVVVSYIQKS